MKLKKKKKEKRTVIFNTNPYIEELVHRAHGFFPLGELSIMSHSVLYPPPRMAPHARCPVASAPRPFTGMRGNVFERLLGTSLARCSLLLWVEKHKDCFGFQGAWVPARMMGK